MTENGTTRKLGFGFLFALPHKCDQQTPHNAICRADACIAR